MGVNKYRMRIGRLVQNGCAPTANNTPGLRLLCIELISRECRIYASMNRVSIGSDNGLSPIRRQAII